jgi:hypothetical protein
VHAALQQYLVAAELDRFADLLYEFGPIDDVSLGVARLAREGTETTAACAYVGVVDVAVDVVGSLRLRV